MDYTSCPRCLGRLIGPTRDYSAQYCRECGWESFTVDFQPSKKREKKK